MLKSIPETLDEWVERMGFIDLKEQWLCHAKQLTDDPDGVVRLMFISLRQDLQEASVKGAVIMFPYKMSGPQKVRFSVAAEKFLNEL